MEAFFNFLVNNIPTILIMAILFLFLYIMGGEDIVFFKKKKYQHDPKAQIKLQKSLNRFARLRGFELIGPTTLEFEGKSYHFDGILIGFYGTIAIAASSEGGDIYGESGQEQWTQIFENKRYKFENPAMTLNGSIKFLKDIYRSEKVKSGLVDTFTVFTHDKANLAISPSMPVYHITKLAEKLDQSKYLADNGSDVQAMKEALLKYSK